MKRFMTLLYAVPLFATALFSQNYTGKLGYGVSPVGHPHDFSQFGAFLQEVAGMCDGGAVLANTSWRDSTGSSGTIPTLQKTVSQLQPVPYNYTDMLVFGFATYPELYLNTLSDTTNNWSNSNMQSLFLQALIRTADSLAPAYLFIGNEVNFYLTQDSADYANWSTFYSMAYDSIKIHSPSTKVGTVFNYEHISGQGSNNLWITPHWNALSDLDTSKMDVVGLTLYPFFNYQDANSVSSTYLDPLFARIGNKPLAITETGWPGDSLFGNWNASDQQQVDWVNKLFTIINGRNVEVTNWLFLNYMMDNDTTPATRIFKSISMRDSLGNDRPALAQWLSHCYYASIDTNENESGGLEVFPNPASSALFVKNISTMTDIRLYNSLGELVFEREAESDVTLDIGQLPTGVYTMTVNDGKETAFNKIVIEK